VMEMCIENQRSGVADLFATHPPIEARIRALVEQAGGHMPDMAQPQQIPASPWTPQIPGGARRGPWG